MQIAGVHVCRSFDWVRLNTDGKEKPGYRADLRVPCEISVTDGGPQLQLELKNTDTVYNTDRHQLDWGMLSGSLELRNWHPGDYYRQAGHSSEIKLKHLFQKARIPSWERHQWPVITHNQRIVWTREFGAAEGFLPRHGAVMVIAIRELSPDRNEKRIRMCERDVYPV